MVNPATHSTMNDREVRCAPAFAHYGCEADVSGVTTWLTGLLAYCVSNGVHPSVHLHHFSTPGADSYLRSSFHTDVSSLKIPISGVNVQSVNFADDAALDVLKYLNTVEPTCFLPQALPTHVYAARLAAQSGLAWAFAIHSDDPEYWAIADSVADVGKDFIWVAVSDSIRDEIIRRYGDVDVRKIPYGVAVPEQRCKFHRPFRVAYVGRLDEPQKRMSLVIDSLVEACQRSPAIETVIIGEGAEATRCKLTVESHGLHDRIRFLGRLSGCEVQAELLQCQAIILMSNFEGLPVALLEAMSCGAVPVVRKIRSGISELISDGRNGVLVGDTAIEAARALVSLSEQPTEWERLSSNARSTIVDAYSAEHCHKLWKNLIGELSERSKVRFPIRIPRAVRLPPFRPELARLDHRKPSVVNRVIGRILQLPRRVAKRIVRVVFANPRASL